MKLLNKRILLIITGGIAAYKSLELIRLIKKSGGDVRCILTKGGAEFITPLSVSSLSGNKCYMDLWNLTDEAEMGHIRLSREADLVVVAPASADFIAKMAHGMANDLASTAILATNKPVMVAPAMNPAMWHNVATQDNIKIVKSRGITIINPADGEMACGETGTGRMVEATDILQKIENYFSANKPLSGKTALVTSGPTFEPIDPVRYIGNRSSGKQGHAIACELRDAGANVMLISGPTALPDPLGMSVIHVETACEMMKAAQSVLHVNIAVCAAAVADYSVKAHTQKQKKTNGGLNIEFTPNPDILQTLSNHKNRPDIVIGFAAETDNLIEYATAKLKSKNCDLIIANQVGNDRVFGRDETSIVFIDGNGIESHEKITKRDVATILIQKICKKYG